MTDDFEKLRSGEWTDGFTPEIGKALDVCAGKCFELNALPPAAVERRTEIIRGMFGSVGESITINSPFRCDFGFNISIGDNFIGNFNLCILDEAQVSIGNHVFIGPNTSLCTIIHSMDVARRNAGTMRALPIVIEDNVWIAANVVVLPGVTIGEGAVVGAGSVVTKDVEPYALVAGNPARKVRSIDNRHK